MIIDEMVAYYKAREKLTEAELDGRLQGSLADVAEQWGDRSLDDADEVRGFYHDVDYVPQLLQYHLESYRHDRDLDIVEEIRAKNRHAKVLDFGCGTGVLGMTLKDLVPTLTVDCYDIGGQAYEFARDFNVTRRKPVEFVNTYDIAHRRYDFILCEDVLEHLPDDDLLEVVLKLQDRLESPYGKIFAQVGHWDGHVSPMHFPWTPERLAIVRDNARLDRWDFNHDFVPVLLERSGFSLGPTPKAEEAPKPAAPEATPAKAAGVVVERAGTCDCSCDQADPPSPKASADSSPQATKLEHPLPIRTTTERTITKRGVLYVGYPCNIRCKFCYYAHNPSSEWHSIEECKRDATLFREKHGNRFVDITGGEPTIYPQIEELLDHCNEIGLSPTLITNMQALASRTKVSRFREHGVADFLCSVHGFGDVYDELTQTKKGWRNVEKAIVNINEAGIPWRANCTVMNVNAPQLRDVAAFVHEGGARVINFISFNPFGDWENRKDIDFQGRHSEVGPHLVEALEYCDEVGLEANVRYFPFCQMPGHEEKCYNFAQLSYDPHEWDFCSWYACETRAPSDKLPDAVREAAYDLESLHMSIARKQRAILYADGSHAACGQCVLRAVCDGFTKQYAGRFGHDEARPYEGDSLVLDPKALISRQVKLVEIHPDEIATAETCGATPRPEGGPESFEQLARAAEASPSVQAAQAAAGAARRLGRTEDALHWYREAFRRDPKSVSSILSLASLALENGSHDSARALFERARNIAPPDVLPRIEAAISAMPN